MNLIYSRTDIFSFKKCLFCHKSNRRINWSSKWYIYDQETWLSPRKSFSNLISFSPKREANILCHQKNHEIQWKSRSLPEQSCFARSRLMGRQPLFACETKRARLQCDPIKGEGQERRRESPLLPSLRFCCEKPA